MIVQMDDPASLLAWLRSAPKRVGAQLQGIRALRPQYAAAIDEAQAMAEALRQAARSGQAVDGVSTDCGVMLHGEDRASGCAAARVGAVADGG